MGPVGILESDRASIPHRSGAAVSEGSSGGIFVTWIAGLTMYSALGQCLASTNSSMSEVALALKRAGNILQHVRCRSHVLRIYSRQGQEHTAPAFL